MPIANARIVFGFHIHHIFPRELFTGPMTTALNNLFANQPNGLSLNMQGNHIALYSNLATATAVQAAIAAGDTSFIQNGFGGSVHGSHYGYNQFIKTEVAIIINDTNLDSDQQRTALYDLHRFATQISQGTFTDGNGNTLGVMGDGSYTGVLESAWANTQIDPTATDAMTQNGLGDYVSGLDMTMTDVGLSSNYESRLIAVENHVQSAFNNGHLTVAQYDSFQSNLQNIRTGFEGSSWDSGYWGGHVSRANIASSYDVAVSTGIGDTTSALSVVQHAFSNFAMNESGAMRLPNFESSLNAVSDFTNTMTSMSGNMVLSLNQLDSATFASMVNSMNSVLVGVGGGFVGDTAEFLNLSYDALKKGLDTGDWGDFHQAIANYGASAVMSAVLIGGTVAMAGPLGWAVSAAWATYSVYDGLDNILDVFDKIYIDGNYWGEHTSDWLNDLKNLFERQLIDPLVIDLDGDGLELTSLDASIARFDLDGDGFLEQTSWVSPDDALLAIDLNGNGTIDDISELFGSETRTGYETLSDYDSDGNGVINAQDSSFGSLLLWQDLNGDGVSDDGELTSLSSAGIVSIGVTPTPSNYWVNGNHVVETSIVTFYDGSTTTSGEVLFNLSQIDSTFSLPNGFEYDPDVLHLPLLQGVGNIPSSWVRMTEDSALVADVEGLIANARAGDYSTYLNHFDTMLANWADVGEPVWRQESGQEVFFTYNTTELLTVYQWISDHPTIIVDGVTYPGELYPGPAPSITGYYFAGGGLGIDSYEPGTLAAWLEESDSLIAYNLNPSHTFWNFVITSYSVPGISVIGSSSGNTYTISTAVGGTELAPDMDATVFAVLQRFMGQDYRLGMNYLAPENVIITTPPDGDIAPLMDAYSGLRDYMSVRFLAQAAWSILANEGDGVDLGALAPFRNIYLDPFTDKVLGKTDNFVKELIEMFRAQGYGTDQEALELLAPFQTELPNVGALVAAEFTDIDRTLITSIFATNQFVEGDAGDNVVIGNSDSILLGHAGNDTLTSNSGDTDFIGGLGDDILTGSVNSDTYLYRTGDGNDTIIDQDLYENTGTDTLTFTDVNSADVGFSRSGNDLIITLANGETVTVVNHLDEDYDYGMDVITFADGVTLGYQEIRDRLVSEMKASGTVTGTSRTENYEHTLGDGSYTITDIDPYGYTGTDTFDFTDVNSTDVTVQRLSSDPNDVVITLASGDQITFFDELVSNNDYGVESISFADGVTWDRNDLLTAPIVDDAFVFV